MPRSSPSPEPFTTVKDLVFSEKKRAPEPWRRAAQPFHAALDVLGLGGNDEASPAVAMIGLERCLSSASDGIGLTIISKPSGMTPFISFSSQVPHGRNAALPCSHSVCD